ncbi:MAG: AraC family transcriptional regulator, partial [Ketobacteraceae bacterium]|nr:AraC family transcriptional regulator [Ketobacteraceae bacterium]
MKKQQTSCVIPSVSARLLLQHLTGQGISATRMLEGSSYSDPDAFQQDCELISAADYCVFIRNALALTGNPALGLTRASQVSLGDFDAYGYAIMSSDSLGAAASIGMEFWMLSGSLLDIETRVENDVAVFEFTPRIPMDDVLPYVAEESMSVIYQLCHFLVGNKFAATEVDFAYPEPVYAAEYHKVFDCPLRFSAPNNAIRVPTAVLNEPLIMSSPQVAALCKAQCDALIKNLSVHDEFVESLRRFLIDAKPDFPTVDEMAERLHISARTLRRRLQERDTTYRDLLDEIRLELAQQYLRDTQLSIDQIAALVGFEETTSFRKAYKSW